MPSKTSRWVGPARSPPRSLVGGRRWRRARTSVHDSLTLIVTIELRTARSSVTMSAHALAANLLREPPAALGSGGPRARPHGSPRPSLGGGSRPDHRQAGRGPPGRRQVGRPDRQGPVAQRRLRGGQPARRGGPGQHRRRPEAARPGQRRPRGHRPEAGHLRRRGLRQRQRPAELRRHHHQRDERWPGQERLHPEPERQPHRHLGSGAGHQGQGHRGGGPPGPGQGRGAEPRRCGGGGQEPGRRQRGRAGQDQVEGGR